MGWAATHLISRPCLVSTKITKFFGHHIESCRKYQSARPPNLSAQCVRVVSGSLSVMEGDWEERRALERPGSAPLHGRALQPDLLHGVVGRWHEPLRGLQRGHAAGGEQVVGLGPGLVGAEHPGSVRGRQRRPLRNGARRSPSAAVARCRSSPSSTSATSTPCSSGPRRQTSSSRPRPSPPTLTSSSTYVPSPGMRRGRLEEDRRWLRK